MTDPSSLPDTDVGSARGPTSRTSRWQKVVGASGLAVVAWVGIDSTLFDAWFSDSGGMDHGPGGGPPGGVDQNPGSDPPPGSQEQETDPGEGGHDPSQWEH